MSFQKKLMDDDFLDDGIDNIHRQYMPVFLLIIDVFLGIKQFVGDPIECFVPKELSGNDQDRKLHRQDQRSSFTS